MKTDRKIKHNRIYVIITITFIYLFLQFFRFFIIKTEHNKTTYKIKLLEYTYNKPLLSGSQLIFNTIIDNKNVEIDTQPTQQKKIEYQNYLVPNINTSFKAYMDYRTITNKTSTQYKLQQQAYTDNEGFRKIGEDYCIALGKYYSNNCGERFLITTDSGEQFTAIIADIKDNRHTNSTNQYVPMKNGRGNVIEFIIDQNIMNNTTLKRGDISHLRFKGNIVSIQKIITIGE